jgi:hypothetical protein
MAGDRGVSGTCGRSVPGDDVVSFLKQIWPVLAFYVLGDLLTTIIAMEMGAPELNPFLAGGMALYGYPFLILYKLAVLAVLVLVYRSCRSSSWWKVSRYSLGVLGLVLCWNNVAVIGGAL